MKYKVKFNERFNKDHFIDMTEKDTNGSYITRDKNSKPWIVDEDRMNYLASQNAIVLLETIKEIKKADKQTETTNKTRKTQKRAK